MHRYVFSPRTMITLYVMTFSALAGCATHTSSTRAYAVIKGERADVPAIKMGDRATVERIITLARNDSHVMTHLTNLCENFGSRLTGSKACDDASLWAQNSFASWGLKNVHRMKWGDLDARFDRLESIGEIVTKKRGRGDDDNSPEWETGRTLEFTTLSWTVGTEGPLVAPVVTMPTSIDQAEQHAERYNGAFVLLPANYGRRGVRSIGFAMRERNDLRHSIRNGDYVPSEEPPREEWTGTVGFEGADMSLTFLPERDDENSIIGGRIEMPDFFAGPVTDVFHEEDSLRFVWANPQGDTAIEMTIDEKSITGMADGQHEINIEQSAGPDEHAMTREQDRVLAKLLEANPAGFISTSSDERVWTTRPNYWREFDLNDTPTDIEINVRRSDYDYINSRIADDQDVFARFDLHHVIEPGPVPVYDVIAEIPGSEIPDEVVIVSAHLDSWDGPGSQGATDNGTGSSVVLEAARLLIESGAKPKRTIRFILWTGEEQGLWGSRKYVESLSEDELTKISAVFVDDGGTNYEGGLPAADHMVDYLAAATAPINGAFYSETDEKTLDVNIRPTGDKIKTHDGSDHAPFNKVGVPGFFWDEIGRATYGEGWHTQNDRIDLAIPEYLVQSSACMAVTAFNLACAPGLLPREPAVLPEPIIAQTGSMSEQPAIGR